MRLRPKMFQVLMHLLEQRHRVVTRQELFEQVWPQQFVSDAALESRVKAVRQAIGDNGGGPRIIQTLRGYGDRFMAVVETGAALIGDAELVAGALLELAEPGAILCSDTTARLVPGAVHLETVQPLRVADRSTAVIVHRVRGVGPRRSPVVQRGERALSRFVGRAREMATLQALLAQVEGDRGQVVGLVGEPGIGKSRLMYEFRRRVAGKRLTYLEGRCLSYGGSTPYLPVLDILRHNCGITDADGPDVVQAKVQLSLQAVGMRPDEWEPYLLQLLGVPDAMERLSTLSPPAIKARSFATLTQLCTNAARRRPLVLEVEDLHWIDPTSEEYLASLADQLAGVPILLVATYRPGYRPSWVTKSYATQLALQRLTSDDSLQVVQGLLHTRQISKALSRMILAKADGNPFFLEELARTVMEDHAPRLALVVPDTVQAVLAARIDRLPPAEKRVRQTAAVIGKDIAFPLPRAIAGLPEEELQQRLVPLQDAEFVYETGRLPDLAYTFKHVLTQEVAYESLLQSTREQIHRAIAHVIVQRFPETVEGQPELLAHHYTEAGLGEPAVGYWQRAGDHAKARSAHAEAIVHLTRGLTVLYNLPDAPIRAEQELSLQIALGTSLTATKGWAAPEVEGVYIRARELCQRLGETPQLGPVLWGLWHFHAVRGEPLTARELAEQFLALAQRSQDPVSLLTAHFVLGAALCLLGECVLARKHWEQSLTYYDSQQHRALALLYGADPGVFCLAWFPHLLWHLGYADQALTRSEEALTLAQKLSHAFSSALALDYAAMLHQFRREPGAVNARAEAAMALCAEQEFAYYLAWGRLMQGWAVAEAGDGNAGMAQMRQGLSALRATGAGLRQPYYLALLAEACGKADRAEEGLTLLAEGLTVAAHSGERWWEAELHRLKGELLLQHAGGNISRSVVQRDAEICFRRALAVARRQHAKALELRAALSLTQLWQQQGQTAKARRLLAPIYGWFTEGFATADLQAASRLLAQLA